MLNCMKLYLFGHDHKYAVEQVQLMLFPDQRPEYPEGKPEGDRAEIALFRGEKRCTAVCRLVLDGVCHMGRAAVSCEKCTDALTADRYSQRIVKLAFYRAALASGMKKPEWGALTGIRPAKLMSQLLNEGLSEKRALSRFQRDYDVTEARAKLCLDAAKAGEAALAGLEAGDVCLYVGIPFCPTRCAYCSFVSNSVEKSAKLIPPFLEALWQDIEATGRAVKELGLRPVSVYMGGGTPTTLSAAQLDELCTRLEANFDLTAVRDYTVEAGRPDTITEEKMRVLHAHGVKRVSVNPQTMQDAVLAAIGRHHTAQDIVDALAAVRRAGEFDVNMDLIAGLPGDSAAGFHETLSAVLALAPENITVHTLALKKGSRITLDETPLPPPEEVGAMLTEAMERLTEADYAPYYLYRQKFMAGGFENVGWSRPGRDNLYNICIMEELCSILSMGGGASTKLVSPAGRIERVFAPKYPLEYIQNIEKVCADKEKIKEFYHGL